MAAPRDVAVRWIAAMSAHDLDAAVACFHPDYRDEAPARRGEVVEGVERVRANFSQLFTELPDLQAELIAAVEDGERIWMEWRMAGTRRDRTRMEFVGVNIFGVRDGRFAWGRIYTELVRDTAGVAGQLDRMTSGEGPHDP